MEPRNPPDSISKISDERLVSRYIDGALDGEELAAFEAVLRERQDLRRLVDEVTAIDASVSRALGAALSSPSSGRATWSEGPDRTAGRFAPPSAPSPLVPPRGTASWMLAAAAIALIALGLWAMLTLPDRAPGDRPPRDFAAVTAMLGGEELGDELGGDELGGNELGGDEEVYEAVLVAPGEGVLDFASSTGRLIDHAVPAVYLPAVSGPSQGTYLEESKLIRVFDREENRFYLFELKHARVVIRPARIDL